MLKSKQSRNKIPNGAKTSFLTVILDVKWRKIVILFNKCTSNELIMLVRLIWHQNIVHFCDRLWKRQIIRNFSFFARPPFCFHSSGQKRPFLKSRQAETYSLGSQLSEKHSVIKSLGGGEGGLGWPTVYTCYCDYNFLWL